MHPASTVAGTSIAQAYNRKPRGPAPHNCYWDAQPGETNGVWRDLCTHAVVDPKALRRKRNAASRHEETTREERAARAAARRRIRLIDFEQAVLLACADHEPKTPARMAWHVHASVW